MSQKETTRPQEPRTVKMYHVVYCTLILVAIAVSLMGGWFLRDAQQDQIKAEASSLVTSLKSK